MRKLKQRLFSLLLCAAMLFSLCAPAAAEGTETYWTWDDTQEKLVEANIPESITKVKDETAQLDENTTGGWYIVQDPMITISGRVNVSGNVHLILADGCALTVNGGIDVSAGNSLTIYAQSTDANTMGKLTATATGTFGASGIGGGGDGENVGGAGGEITINGGKVEATGFGGGAGIGGGYCGAGGEITITGGTVEANSASGAGIGGGAGGNGGIIEISGGTVTATSEGSGAGIGGGYGGTGGEIKINGGTVSAQGRLGAGIGGGADGNGGTINISGNAKVNATSSGNGAGIGGGGGADEGAAGGSGGNITISGGSVTANSKNGAGIGGGERGSGGEITINGGTVRADSRNGAGIGGGNDGGGGTITINGGTVEATSSSGAGIGGGAGSDGDQITINGGTVTAKSTSSGAGIGGGSRGAGGEITISGGTVTASGDIGAGIGGGGSDGIGGPGGTIIITGGTVTATSSSEIGAGIGGGGVYAGGSGDSGTFTTGPNGSAFIVANGISDQSGKENGSWSGVIFGGGRNGKVYGREITLATDAEIPAKRTLEVGAGQILTIGEGVKLTNNGSINNQGTINNLGTIDGLGKIEGNAVVVPSKHGAAEGWAYDSSSHWHPCAVADCTDNHQFDKAAHDFGAWVTDIPATAATAGRRSRTCGTCAYTQTEAIPPEHSHSYGQAWMSDAAGHWHECSCGDQSGYAAHTPGEWIIDREATASKPGQQHKECTVCGYTTQTEAIPATGGGSGGGNSGGGTYTPSATPTYPPAVEKPGEGGGTPAISPSNPKQGDTVTVTPKPDEGYEVDKITVTDRHDRPVEVTKKPDGTYTFVQPGGQVTIEIEYAPVPLTGLPWENPFTDVDQGDWYYEAVRFVHERGLMNGYEDGRFGPNDTLSRAQLAQILFNKEGQPGGSGQPDFTDVTGSAWYAPAVRWAAGQGIAGGYGNGAFGPNDPITREQLAVMLWRYSGSPAATDQELHFNDADEINPFALEALRWAVENGILNGYGDGRLGPKGQATRAQVAQMLMNHMEAQGKNA